MSRNHGPCHRPKRCRRRGFTLFEMLVAAALGVLTITVGTLLFMGGLRTALGTQAGSHALRKGVHGLDSLRFELMEATTYLLPTDAAPFTVWNNGLLGPASTYSTQSQGHTVATAIYLSLPTTRPVPFRTGQSQSVSLGVANRLSVSQGQLIFRGNADGTPNPTGGTYLWAWRYSQGALVGRRILCRRLSSTVDAVAFRRGSASGNTLRYRIVFAEADSNQKERTSLGQRSENLLESSDLAISLLNFTGGVLASGALPNAGEPHP